MIALDTNILARFLLRDHEKQYHTAVSLLQQDRIYTAPPSVILELAWALQVNDCTRAEIVKGLRALFGLPNFKPMALDEIDRALIWFDAGMEFGDRRAPGANPTFSTHLRKCRVFEVYPSGRRINTRGRVSNWL
jgi:hypothetical protein